MKTTVATFYKFAGVPDPDQFRGDVLAFVDGRDLKGTLLIAHEGINATMSGLRSEIDALIGWLRTDPRFSDMAVKFSGSDGHPFARLKVKVKPEIVTFGQSNIDPVGGTGTYVAPEDWNALISQPDVVLVDTRNTYECEIGTFEGAIDPRIASFREFPAYVERELDPKRNTRVAMFCTGGIRCEKATAYLKARGFKDVYHLEGGILKYLEVVPAEESLWRGACFIFDQRVALGQGVTLGHHRLCERCGYPIAEASSACAEAERGVCPKCGVGAETQPRWQEVSHDD